MASEIVMGTPAAKALEASVQRRLAEFGYSGADDPVMAEYVVVMLANSKTADDITRELRELVGEDLYDVTFTTWLFDEVSRQYGGGGPSGAGTGGDNDDTPAEGASRIPTIADTREGRRDERRSGRGGFGSGIFDRAMGGLKRPANEMSRDGRGDRERDPPPHRRARMDDPELDSLPRGPRQMHDERDQFRNGAANGDRRDQGRGGRGPRGPNGGGPGRSLLERTGMTGAVNPAFANGGFDHQQAMMQQQMIQMGQPFQFPGQMMPPQFFPGGPGGQPQLFLANGQPFIPPSGFPMQGFQGAPPSQPQAAGPPSPQRDLATLPKKPDDKECKYNRTCKNAWCTHAHVTPAGTKDSMMLSFEACEKQVECKDPECTKAHVSPQQRDPASSVWSKPASAGPVVPTPPAPAARAPPHPSAINPTPCRFGAGCTRPDCVFTHPWNQKGGKVPVPCKFGLGCTRADCHFQHPPGRRAGGAAGPAASKNISKSFTDQIGPMASSDESKINRLKRFAGPGGEVEKIIPGSGTEAKEGEAGLKVNGDSAAPADAKVDAENDGGNVEDPSSPANQLIGQ